MKVSLIRKPPSVKLKKPKDAVRTEVPLPKAAPVRNRAPHNRRDTSPAKDFKSSPFDFKRHKTKIGFLLFFILGSGLFLGLTTLRVYSMRIEITVNQINAKIDKLQAEQILLKTELASITAPSKIFTFAEKKLGMVYASKPVTLHIEGTEAPPNLKYPEKEEGWFHFFLEKAMAGE